ncbi:MAG: transporter, partial [Rhizorhabdus sp.]|nr:transporter [Rhizorhabdus sp.]
IAQPLIGALSDRTVSRWGRRTPYFLIGALLCSLGLLAMPYSPVLWVAASLLWILDAGNNITMEPYRAYLSDRLDDDQRPLGFLTQSAFTGLAQALSYLAPSFLVYAGMDGNIVDANGIPRITRIAFLIGAVLSMGTIIWSVMRVPELPLTEDQIARMRRVPLSLRSALRDIVAAIVEMPRPMWQLALAMLCQWYAMFCYWQFITFAIARSLFGTADPTSAPFRDAVLLNGQIGGFYNFIAFLAAFALMPFTRRFGAGPMHALCLLASGVAMLSLPSITSTAWLFVPMLGIGIGWASMMGNPYAMLANAVPSERAGIYMGIFNMFIVVPMLIESLTIPLFYESWLAGDPRNVLYLAGGLMMMGAMATMVVRDERG